MASRDWLIENPDDSSALVLVPEGPFIAGGPRHFEGGCEPFQVSLPAFYICLYPVTNAQYKRFIDLTGHAPPSGPRSASAREAIWEGRVFRPEMANHPVVGVAWDDARAYADWAGLRLPRELEWEKAARGTDGRQFPWGDEWLKGLCRNDESRYEETTCEVWRYGEGCSVWGCYQMSGNVWEWCEDWYDPSAYKRYAREDLSAPGSGTHRVARGGSWFNVGPDSFLCAYRFHLPPDERDFQYGFRLAREAGSLATPGARAPSNL